MSEKDSCKGRHSRLDAGAMKPIRYIEMDELERKLEKGIPLEEVALLEPAWTATNVPVMDHLRYLRAIRALEIRDGFLILTSVPA